MSKRRQIINQIIDSLKLINGTVEELPNCPRSPYTFITNVYGNVFNTQRYLDEVNDFPSICCYQISSETRNRIGNRETYCSFILEIRGYIQAEDSITASADLAQDLQYVVDSMKYRTGFKELGVVECWTESLSTDEGLLEPQGVAELRVLVVYIQDYNI